MSGGEAFVLGGQMSRGAFVRGSNVRARARVKTGWCM